MGASGSNPEAKLLEIIREARGRGFEPLVSTHTTDICGVVCEPEVANLKGSVPKGFESRSEATGNNKRSAGKGIRTPETLPSQD